MKIMAVEPPDARHDVRGHDGAAVLVEKLPRIPDKVAKTVAYKRFVKNQKFLKRQLAPT